jgi:3-oxoacyl-[acyl-carrier-protein] synthase II
MTARVVITGVGLASPIGHRMDAVSEALQSGRHGIVRVDDWARIDGIETRLGGVVQDLPLDRRWPRHNTRSMGRVARLAAFASDEAIANAALDDSLVRSGQVGLAYGSTHGSSSELERFCRSVFGRDSVEGIASSAYLRFMSHTTAANLAALYGIRGRVISTCAACVSASQAVGAGYEAIRAGRVPVMICGGAEELHWVPAGVFDILYAASRRYNDTPDASPRPFDAERDGLVVAEGSGTLVLEDLDHARARGVPIHAEVVGYGTTCDGTHVTSPSEEGMASAMRLALADARLSPDDIDYVNAHATATHVGDVAESIATLQVLGDEVPISSTKGFTGHTLGACGTIEAIMCLAMMRDGFLAPNRNLENLDPECAGLDYVCTVRKEQPELVMTNNFAFGGINTSLVLARFR